MASGVIGEIDFSFYMSLYVSPDTFSCHDIFLFLYFVNFYNFVSFGFISYFSTLPMGNRLSATFCNWIVDNVVYFFLLKFLFKEAYAKLIECLERSASNWLAHYS